MSAGWGVVLAVHLLAMAFFVGGQLFVAVAVVPVERHDDDRAPLRAIARRFGWGSLAAIGVLAATGVAMATRFELWGEPLLHAKLTLVVVVAVLVAWHMRRPAAHALAAAILLASLAILALGVALAH